MHEYLELKATDCKHCYKCIRNCPVKAIRFSDNQATIMPEECVLCGRCFVSCPQNAKRVHSDVEKAKALIATGAPVVVSLAPSFVANWPGSGMTGMRQALQKLGFADAGETALGATLVKQKYDEMVNAAEQTVILSTCCHTVNLLVQKYYPAVLPYLAQVVSPMQAHCAAIKAETPGAKTVFVGPCISKKSEVDVCATAVDCALTFEELSEWMKEAGVTPSQADRQTEKGEQGRARLFPTAGGILRSMKRDNKEYDYISVDGMQKCIAVLEDLSAGNLQNCFVEMSACIGSCIGGPAMGRHAGPVRSATAVNAFAPRVDFSVAPLPEEAMVQHLAYSAPLRPRYGEAAIAEVLRKTGKSKPEDELNCGSCGYDTCREKAGAVLAGKASLEMCVPYLMGKTQSFSETIIKNTPNGIMVLNEALEVQQLNRAACRIFNVKNESSALGRSVVCLMEPTPFLDALDSETAIHDGRLYLAEYDCFVQLTVVRDKEYGVIIGIMRDVTEQETAKVARRQLAEKTIGVTDEVIEKQMRTVQEIASLLGETAAETQIALQQLKETLSHE